MKHVLTLGYFLLGSIAISMPGCTNAEKKGPLPNIMIILVDDMGYSDIGSYGAEIETPNIDQLAYEGMRFTRFYNTSKCFPSRAVLLTGQYAQRVGMNVSPATFANGVTLAEVLRNSGYRTLMTGKHHGLENPVDFGFDRYFGLRDGMSNHFNPGIKREGEPEPARKVWSDGPAIRTWGIDSVLYQPYTPPEKDFYSTDYFTNYALDYLEEYKDEDKPFFLYVAYTAPHDALMAWPEDQRKYLGKYMVGYEVIRKNRYERMIEMGLIDERFPLSAPTYEDWDALTLEDKLVRDSVMATHAAMIDRVDQNIGRLLDKLRSLNKLDNTIILFMSDNGAQDFSDPEDWLLAKNKISDFSKPIGSMGRFTSLPLSWANVCNTPFRLYKDFSHEGGIATPFIFYWNGISNPGSITDYPAHFIDIMPTILELTGSEYLYDFPDRGKINSMDGISLAPLLKGDQPERGRPIYWQWQEDKAIRKDNWKLVSDDNEPWELYDISVDQTETNNVIEEYPDVAKELIKDWESWINENDDIESMN